MGPSLRVALVLAVFLLGIVVGAAVYSWILRMDVLGNVDVEGEGFRVEVGLNIDSGRGSATYKDLATVRVPEETCIVFRPSLERVEGNFTLLLGGILTLKPLEGGETYTIHMPCLVERGTRCVRIQTVIPGYDEPMSVKPGTYSVSLQLTWTASGKGSFHLAITGYTTTCNASP